MPLVKSVQGVEISVDSDGKFAANINGVTVKKNTCLEVEKLIAENTLFSAFKAIVPAGRYPDGVGFKVEQLVALIPKPPREKYSHAKFRTERGNVIESVYLHTDAAESTLRDIQDRYKTAREAFDVVLTQCQKEQGKVIGTLKRITADTFHPDDLKQSP